MRAFLVHVCREKYDKAIECLQKAVNLNKDFSDTWYNSGYSYMNLENYDKAIECFRKVLNADNEKTDKDALFNIGFCCVNKV